MNVVGEVATHYEVLGVGVDATEPDIKIAYRRQVRIHHPDVGGSAETTALINNALTVLNDPTLRRAYDLSLVTVEAEVAEPEAWGTVDDEWLDEVVGEDYSGPDEPVALRGSRRARASMTTTGWILLACGAWAASTLWLSSNGAAPPAAAGAVTPIIVLAVVTGTRVRGAAAGRWLWAALMSKREANTGATEGILGRLSLGLLRVAIATFAWLLLHLLGWLSVVACGLAVASGMLVDLGGLPTAGLIVAVVGGVLARVSPVVALAWSRVRG